jgi:ABC-type phosphate/phosphonate transport system permease subunit
MQQYQHPTAPPPPYSEEPDNGRRIAIIIAVLILLLGLGVAVFFLMETNYDVEGMVDTAKNDSTYFLPFIPIWIAVFVPFMIAKKKKNLTSSQQLNLNGDQKRVIVMAAVGVALIIAFSVGLIFLTASR